MCGVGLELRAGEAEDVALPPPPAVVPPRPAEKKKEEPAKADAAKKQGGVEAKPAAKAKVAVKSRGSQFAPGVVQPAAAALDAQAAQYVRQFRPMFRAESYFIRNTWA